MPAPAFALEGRSFCWPRLNLRMEGDAAPHNIKCLQPNNRSCQTTLLMFFSLASFLPEDWRLFLSRDCQLNFPQVVQ